MRIWFESALIVVWAVIWFLKIQAHLKNYFLKEAYPGFYTAYSSLSFWEKHAVMSPVLFSMKHKGSKVQYYSILMIVWVLFLYIYAMAKLG